MSSPAAVPRPRRRDVPVPARALAVLAALHGGAHLAGTRDVFARAAGGDSADYPAGAWSVSDPALRSSVVGVAADLVLVAIAVRAGGLRGTDRPR